MTIRHGSRGRTGQTIYEVMLIMTCVALAIAATFPTLDYIKSYRGPMLESPRPAVASRALPAASATTAPAPTPDETTDTTTLPAEPAPAE